MNNQEKTLALLKHFAVVAGLAVANVVLLMVLQNLQIFKVETLPVNLQGVAYLLLPSIVLAVQKLQAQIALEASQAQTAVVTKELVQTKGLLAKSVVANETTTVTDLPNETTS